MEFKGAHHSQDSYIEAKTMICPTKNLKIKKYIYNSSKTIKQLSQGLLFN